MLATFAAMNETRIKIYKNIKTIIVTIGLMFLFIKIYSQNNTLLVVDTVFIVSSTLPYSALNTENFEKSNMQNTQNISELLTRGGGVFIKNYGPFSISSSAIRGGAANHTNISWNGTPITNPMLGQLDISLLPLSGFDNILLYKGSEAALAGSGAIGGGIDLGNKLRQGSMASLQLSSGSYGRQKISLDLNQNIKRFSFSASLGHDQARNDFEYYPAPGFTRKNENGEGKISHAMVGLIYHYDANNTLFARTWHTVADRNIPPTTVQSASNASLLDNTWRTQLGWQHTRKHFSYQPMATLLADENIFQDPSLNSYNINKYHSLIVENRLKWFYRDRNKVFFNAMFTGLSAQTEAYKQVQIENRVSAIGSYERTFKSFSTTLELRKDFISRQSTPLIPSLGLNAKLNFCQISLRAQKSYRLPTLNERYWTPGGNQNILAESGLSEDLSISSAPTSNVRFKLALYNRNLDNYIQWLPIANQFIYSASNISKVWTRGFETSAAWAQTFGQNKLDFNIGFSFTKATNEVEIARPSIKKGSQLFYTPLVLGTMDLGYSWKKLRFQFRPLFVGKSNGLNENVPAYALYDLKTAYVVERSRMDVGLSLNCRNLTNKQYFVVERRAMPGRNFSLDLSINWK